MIDYNDREHISVVRAIDELLSDESAKWSHEAAYRLVKWLEEKEEDTGIPQMFDPVDLRCTFSEYTEDELIEAYSLTLEEIQQKTTVLQVWKGRPDNYFMVQEF